MPSGKVVRALSSIEIMAEFLRIHGDPSIDYTGSLQPNQLWVKGDTLVLIKDVRPPDRFSYDFFRFSAFIEVPPLDRPTNSSPTGALNALLAGWHYWGMFADRQSLMYVGI